jgi:hypothetical protein
MLTHPDVLLPGQVAGAASLAGQATAQQVAIYDAAADGGSLAIHALAGTGKTTTVGHLSTKVLPAGACIYLAYNKAAKEDAEQRFGKGVVCRTMHGHAYRGTRDRYKDRTPGSLLFRQWRDLAPAHAVDGISLALQRPRAGLKVIRETLERYVQSGDAHPHAAHVPREYLDAVAPTQRAEFGMLVTQAAEQVFERVAYPGRADAALPIPFDFFLKVFQLHGGYFEQEVVVLDEAQDSNGVTIALLRAHAAAGGRLVVVGDPHQSIYGWRGAVDAMSEFAALQPFPLTQSFRFGQALCEFPNGVLELLGAKHPLIGAGDGNGQSEPARAMVFRTNKGMLLQALELADAGERVHCSKDARALARLYDAVIAMQANCWDREDDWQAGRYPGQAEVREADGDWLTLALHQEDPDLKAAVGDVEKDPHAARELAGRLANFTPTAVKQADIELCTAHGAKGRQWRHVVLGEDFAGRILRSGGAEALPRLQHEEARLLYVAATRAMHSISIDEAVRADVRRAATLGT